MGYSQSLFPLKIYRDVYPDMDHINHIRDNLFPKFENIFEEAEKNNVGFMQDGTLCSYNDNAQLHRMFPEETKEIVAFVEKCAMEYWKECLYFDGLTPFVMQMWANTTPKGGWVQHHLHGSIPFTAVLYIDASPEQGNLFLENPLDMILMSQPIGTETKYPLGDEIEVNSGDLVLFPGFLKHAVKPNTTDRPRLILGFNLGSRGHYFAGQWGEIKWD